MQKNSSPTCDEFLAVLNTTVVEPLRERGAAPEEMAVGPAAVTRREEEGSRATDGSSPYEPGSLAAAFARIPDPRRKHLRVHSLVSLLQVAVTAMLAGMKSAHAIAQWARDRFEDAPDLLESLGVAKGRCPSGPTFHRVLKSLSGSLLMMQGASWLGGEEPLRGVTIGMDGKTARGTIPQGSSEGVHMVSATVVQKDVVIAQEACPGKGKELATGKRVLRVVPLDGNLLIADALFTQRDVCNVVVGRGGDYLFPVKENQPQLLSDVERAFADLNLDRRAKLPDRVGNWFAQKDDRWRRQPLVPEKLPEPLLPEALRRRLGRQGIRVTAYLDAPCKPAHGRFERREIWVMYHPKLNQHAGEAGEVGKPWPHLKQVCWIKRERVTPEGPSLELSYAVTSLTPEDADATRVGTELRGYWASVENRLHGVRDVTLDEDASHVCAGSGAEVMAALRNLALGVLRRAGTENIAAKLRTLAARFGEAASLVLQTRIT